MVMDVSPCLRLAQSYSYSQMVNLLVFAVSGQGICILHTSNWLFFSNYLLAATDRILLNGPIKNTSRMKIGDDDEDE